MEANVILGYDIGTDQWIKTLREYSSTNIIVLDYNYFGEPKMENAVLLISPYDIKKYIHQFESINYYKSLYSLPGMSGKMSELYKKDSDI